MFDRWFHSTFEALSHPQFRLLFFGTLSMQIAFGMLFVIQGIVAFDLTGKNSAVGIVALGSGVTVVVFSPLGGALADRFPKTALVQASQAVVGAALAVTGVLILTDAITIWLLFLGTLAMGGAFALMGPARNALIPEVVTGALRANAIALGQLAVNGPRVVGPFIAAGLIAIPFVGAGGVYLFMAGLFVLAMVFLQLMPRTRPAARSGRSMFGDLAVGMSYIWRTGELRSLTFVYLGVTFSALTYQAILPGFLENELGREADDVGLLFGVVAVGGILLTLVFASRSRRGARGWMFSCGLLLGGCTCALAFMPSYLAAAVALFGVGAFAGGFQLLNNVSMMEIADPQYYGRVMVIQVFSFGVQGIAAYPFGVFADAVGERETLFASGCVAVAVVLLGMLATLGPRFRWRPASTSS